MMTGNEPGSSTGNLASSNCRYFMPGQGEATDCLAYRPGQQSVGARGDDAEDPAGGREVLGREIKEPGGDLLKSAANAEVPGPACIGEGDGAVNCYQSRGGQLGYRRFDRRAVKFPGVGDSGDELTTVDTGTAGCGDGEHQPLVERDVGSGQQRLQEGAEGALGLADDLGAERRVVGHDCSPRLVGGANVGVPNAIIRWPVQQVTRLT